MWNVNLTLKKKKKKGYVGWLFSLPGLHLCWLNLYPVGRCKCRVLLGKHAMRYQMGRDLSRNHSIKPTFEHCDGLVRKTKCFENQF